MARICWYRNPPIRITGSAWKPEGPHGQFTIPSLVYWDLGEPLEHFDDISQAQTMGASGVYRGGIRKGWCW
jgi:hypothetical protein